MVDVHEILPQQPPFVMIDKLCHCDMVTTRTQLHITEENLFCEKGRFVESGIIENIAQTCAARMGYLNYIQHERVKVGFIGALKNLEIKKLPLAGEVIDTTIEVKNEVMAVTLVEAKVMCANRLVASCEMKIALSDN